MKKKELEAKVKELEEKIDDMYGEMYFYENRRMRLEAVLIATGVLEPSWRTKILNTSLITPERQR
jgi:hypothetical protein